MDNEQDIYMATKISFDDMWKVANIKSRERPGPVAQNLDYGKKCFSDE